MLWSAGESARPGKDLLVVLHGAASSERDLFRRLVPLLPPGLVVAAVRGPEPEANGYSWFSLETRRNAVSDLAVAAAGTDVARSVLTWLDPLPPFRAIGVLGVSQGACVALQ